MLSILWAIALRESIAPGESSENILHELGYTESIESYQNEYIELSILSILLAVALVTLAIITAIALDTNGALTQSSPRELTKVQLTPGRTLPNLCLLQRLQRREGTSHTTNVVFDNTST